MVNPVAISNEHELSAISQEVHAANQSSHLEGLTQTGLEEMWREHVKLW